MMKDLISIIVPIYNAELYLKECLNAIKNQTYKNIEIILIDDGSTDNSSNICDEFAKIDDRFKVFHNNNHGIAYCRNFGVCKAKGKYVMFCDSDDLYDLEIVEKMYNYVKKYNVDMARCSYKSDLYTDRIDDIANKVVKVDEKLVSRFLTIKNNIPCYLWILIVKREIIEDIDTSLSFLEDTCLMIKMLMKVKTIYFSNEKLYYYRTNQLSITKNPNNLLKNIKSAYLSYSIIDEVLLNNNLLSKELKARKNTCLINLVFAKINQINNNYYKKNKKEIDEVLNDRYFREALNNSINNELGTQAIIFKLLLKYRMNSLFFKYNALKKSIKSIIK